MTTAWHTGEKLKKMVKNKGVQMAGYRRSHHVSTEKLKDLGIEYMQSSRWQKVNDVPKELAAVLKEKSQGSLYRTIKKSLKMGYFWPFFFADVSGIFKDLGIYHKLAKKLNVCTDFKDIEISYKLPADLCRI